MPNKRHLDLLKKRLPSLKEAALEVSLEPDELTAGQVNSLEEEEQKAKLLEITQNIEERKKYARYIFCLIAVWLIVIMFIVFLNGYGCMKLSDSVLITLITTTTANVAAFFLVVTRYLFPVTK